MKEKTNTIITYLVYFGIIAACIIAIIIGAQFIISTPFSARSDFSAVCYDNKIFVAGGKDSEGELLDTIFEIDLFRRKIRKISDLPVSAISMAAAELNGKAWFAGGYQDSDYSSEIHVLDLKTRKMEGSFSLDTEISYGSLFSYKDAFYYIGGWDGKKDRRAIMKIDPDSKDVSSPAGISAGLLNFSMVLRGSNLYVFGGETSQGEILQKYSVYDMETFEETGTGKLPMPVSRSSAVLFDDEIYLFGGYYKGIRAEAWRICNLDGELKFEKIRNLPEPNQRFFAFKLKDQIFLVGGKNSDMERQINIIEYIPDKNEYEPVILKNFMN